MRERIWKNYIEEDLFGSAQPASGQPVAYLLAGQPGSGKSTLRENINKELGKDSGDLVEIDIDHLRGYNRDYKSLSRIDSYRAADAVQEDAKAWHALAKEKAISGKYNVVLDGTLAYPKQAVNLCRDLKEKGYEVRIVVAGRPEEDSRLGIVNRHEQMRAKSFADPNANTLAPRFVDPKHHDGKAAGVAQSVGDIARAGLADRILVYEVGYGESELRYVSEEPARDGDRAVKTLEDIQRAPPSPETIAHRMQICEKIDRSMRARGASEDERAKVGIDATLERARDAYEKSPDAKAYRESFDTTPEPPRPLRPLDVQQRFSAYMKNDENAGLSAAPIQNADRVRAEVHVRAEALGRLEADKSDSARGERASAIRKLEANKMKELDQKVLELRQNRNQGREMD